MICGSARSPLYRDRVILRQFPAAAGAAPFSENWRGTRRSGRRWAGGSFGKRDVKSACEPASCPGGPCLGAGQSRVRARELWPGFSGRRVPYPAPMDDGPNRAGGCPRPPPRPPSRPATRPTARPARRPTSRPTPTGPSLAAVPRAPRRRPGPRSGRDRRSLPPVLPPPLHRSFLYSTSSAPLFDFAAAPRHGFRPAGRAEPVRPFPARPRTAKRPILAGGGRNSAPQDPSRRDPRPHSAALGRPRTGPDRTTAPRRGIRPTPRR